MTPPDLYEVTGAPSKGLCPVGGRPSLQWTLDALRASRIESCVTVGAESLKPAVTFGDFQIEAGSAVDNALAGARALSACESHIYLPADLPLLTARDIEAFVDAIERRVDISAEEVWFAAGLCPAQAFERRFPGSAYKSLRLREGRMLSGGLYASSAQGLLRGARLFADIRRRRRSVVQMLFRLGSANLAAYALGRIDLPRAEQTLERLLGGRVVIVPDCSPESCLDFDDAREYQLAQKYIHT